jgi:hypothetical protein
MGNYIQLDPNMTSKKEKSEALIIAEELVRLSKQSVEICKNNPQLYDEEQLKLEQEILEKSNKILEGIKNQ